VGRSKSARPAVFAPAPLLQTRGQADASSRLHQPSCFGRNAPRSSRFPQPPKGCHREVFPREAQAGSVRSRWPDNRVRPSRGDRPTHPLTTPLGAIGTGFRRRPGYGPSGTRLRHGHQNAAPRPTLKTPHERAPSSGEDRVMIREAFGVGITRADVPGVGRDGRPLHHPTTAAPATIVLLIRHCMDPQSSRG
jgi:hypothetical protein